MFRNVLIGVDGRQGGRDAIALARQLAGNDAKLILAHVDDAPVGVVSGLDRDMSRRLLEEEHDRVEVAAETALTFALSVGRGLHDLALNFAADLLVVGSTHHALLGRVLLGDNCLGSLDGAPCAIAVATHGYAQSGQAWHRIGIGYDGSPESEAALIVAQEIAAHHGAALAAYYVATVSEVTAEKPLPTEWPKTIQTVIDRHADRLAQLPDIKSTVTYGLPADELVKFGANLDLMLVGSRGYGPLGRLFHGSVSRHLVQNATSPILVLPRAAMANVQLVGAGGNSSGSRALGSEG